MQANISKSLNNVGFTNPTNLQTKLGHILLFFDKVIQTMEHTSTSGTSPTMNTTLVDWFTSDAGTGIHVSVSNGVSIGISNPCHLSLTALLRINLDTSLTTTKWYIHTCTLVCHQS